MRLAVLASHEGTTLQAVIDACEHGELNAEVGLVVSNNSSSGAMRRAEKAGALTLHISSQTHSTEQARDEALLDALQQAKVEWVLLLGYMKKLGVHTLAAYNGRILNTHPALLPKFGGKGFYGRKVHAAVIDAGEKETGATVHLVDTEYDTGPLLAQVQVPVLDNDTIDTLEARVKAAEQNLLINTLIEMSNRREASNYS